jgi:Peptidase M15
MALRHTHALAARGVYALAAVLGAGCAQSPPAVDDFGAWRAERADAVQALEAHLAQQGLVEVLPLRQLLRSASSWQSCGAAPWALPPAAQWPALVSVLRLVQALRAAGAIGAIEVHSGYRDAALNGCAGGAARSAHLLGFAIDFTPADGRDLAAGLCAFWREQGRDWRMGLGRYPTGRIHIDTAGFRAWGGVEGGHPCGTP